MGNCTDASKELANGSCCGFGKKPDALGLQCIDFLNTNFDSNLVNNLNTDLGEHKQGVGNGDNSNIWLQFLNPNSISNLANSAAGIITATKAPAPVTNNITNIETPPEAAANSVNSTAIIGGVVGAIVLVMVFITLSKRKKISQ
jgi:uncharacterized membrane protein YeaQ/YmgE (transglycosylase-associated protein family)